MYFFGKKVSDQYTNAVIFLRQRPVFTTFLVFVFFFSIFFAVYFSVGKLAGNDDHFFHFRFAQEMLNKGFFQSFSDFKSIYFSKMAQGNEYFMYYNFLFYLLVIPFTFITPLFLGIKLYAVFAAGAAFTLLYWCLKQFSVKNPFIWTLILFSVTNAGFVKRFLLSRPYTLAPALLLLLLYFLYKRNRIGVFLISFAYLFWHSSTFFLPVCVTLCFYLAERFHRSIGDRKTLLASIYGTLAAVAATFLVSSGFLLFLKDTLFGIYWDTILGKNVPIAEGAELYPINVFLFARIDTFMFSGFILAVVLDVYGYIAQLRFITKSIWSDISEQRRHLQTCIFLVTISFALGSIVVSARFVDFFTFFAALYVALTLDKMRSYVVLSNEVVRKAVAMSIFVVVGYLFLSNLLTLQESIAYNVTDFSSIGGWLEMHSKPGDIVVLEDWSWFPQLYYYSPKNYYSSGLEPRFMYTYNPGLYWESVHLKDGYLCREARCPDIMEAAHAALWGTNAHTYAFVEGDNIARALKNDFHASYIVISGESAMNYIASNNSHFVRNAYDEDSRTVLYSLK